MATIFETERLVLRTLQMEDSEEVMQFWGNQEVMKYCGGSSGDKSKIEGTIKFYMAFENENGFSPYAVVLKESNRVIGCCGYNPTEKEDEIELIYHFSKPYWGQGYATEAGIACISHAKENLKINKIIASVDPNNITSRRILDKLGFEYIGKKWFEDMEQEEPCFEMIVGTKKDL